MNSLGRQLRSSALRYQWLAQRSIAARFAKRTGATTWRAIPGPELPLNERVAVSPIMSRQTRLEAVLFLAREPLALRRLAQLANLTDGTEARTLMNVLKRRYEDRGSAFQIVQLAGGYQILSRPEFSPWLRPRAQREQELRLSPPSLETLAVVAYRQPVLRAEVEAIRGVGCGEILRQLMDQDLLRIVGRSDELGRPLWYGTTKRFLQVFGLCNLEQLPLAAQLRRKCDEAPLAAERQTILSASRSGLTGEAGAA